ncbi:MAG TPA: phosphotransferase, partial [Caulobacteraceae bacterium]|nr:phosphotransferase [Caulobacteraceae bacterium]
ELGFGRPLRLEALGGGVSCDVIAADLADRRVVVKRALPRLRVAADWRAPPERTRWEWRWFEAADAIVPGAAPRVLAHDDALNAFAMDWLEPATHPLWKRELLEGRIDPHAAAEVGERLARIHAGTAGRADLAAAFDTGPTFHDLRLDPYLLETGRRRPEVAAPIAALVARTAATRLALVHGDVSPKNILLGPKGPVFLDAETAWWGDPAFDVAFCLNHLLLKDLVVAGGHERLAASFAGFVREYLARVDWEPPAALEARAASLLPGLFLARVDGKSPVEYLAEGPQREAVRRVAIPLLMAPPARLADVAVAWYGRPG